MQLDSDSIAWALKHLALVGDSDLFPRSPEIEVAAAVGQQAIDRLSALDLSRIDHGPARRFIIPKDKLSYRVATQLHPLDTIILAALIYQFGPNLEALRVPCDRETVFSHRYRPTADGQLYDAAYSWNRFWAHCQDAAARYRYVVVLDIADCYNQIYHHAIENQLARAGLPDEVRNWIAGLLKSITARVSRGVPVGPHLVHILAETALAAIDGSLQAKGIAFCRYVDDMVLFCSSEKEALTLVFEVASVLDKQQRLMLQNQKTRIMTAERFRDLCATLIEDRPINDLESSILSIIRKYAKGDPYRVVRIGELSEEDLAAFDEEVVTRILDGYLEAKDPDYARLRWFMRRLSQVGRPAGVRYCVEHFDRMLPAIGEVCRHLISVSRCSDCWEEIGAELLRVIDDPLVHAIEYLQLCVYSLFSSKVELNHFQRLIGGYRSLPPFLKREVILLAHAARAIDWLRELKEEFGSMDDWTRRAFLVASAALPKDERRFFLKHVKARGPLEDLLIEWSRSQ